MATSSSEHLMFFKFNNKTIKTTVTSKGKIAAKWINQVQNDYRGRRDNLIVGLDTEGYFTQKRGGKVRCAVLQLCIGSTCLVYQIYCRDFLPRSLAEFLKDAKNTFVGVAVEDDARLLKEDFGLEVANALDLRFLAAERLGSSVYEKYGLKRLCEHVLQVELEKDKGISWRTDSRARKLKEEEIRYACLDAAASFFIGLSLMRKYHSDINIASLSLC